MSELFEFRHATLGPWIFGSSACNATTWPLVLPGMLVKLFHALWLWWFFTAFALIGAFKAILWVGTRSLYVHTSATISQKIIRGLVVLCLKFRVGWCMNF